MSVAAIIELLEALLKILPEVVKAVESVHAAVSEQAKPPLSPAESPAPSQVDHNK